MSPGSTPVKRSDKKCGSIRRDPKGTDRSEYPGVNFKELWAFDSDRIAVRFQYEWRDHAANWCRAYGNENWEFDESDLMRWRQASINDLYGPTGISKFAISARPSVTIRTWSCHSPAI